MGNQPHTRQETLAQARSRLERMEIDDAERALRATHAEVDPDYEPTFTDGLAALRAMGAEQRTHEAMETLRDRIAGLEAGHDWEPEL